MYLYSIYLAPKATTRCDTLLHSFSFYYLPRSTTLLVRNPFKAQYLGDEMNPKIGVIYHILLEFLLRCMNHKPF